MTKWKIVQCRAVDQNRTPISTCVYFQSKRVKPQPGRHVRFNKIYLSVKGSMRRRRKWERMRDISNKQNTEHSLSVNHVSSVLSTQPRYRQYY